jgi:hypothetical protein
MSGKSLMAVAAILLGSTGLASAQFVVFPQQSYWYGGGFYSPQTGTGVGIEPPNDYLPGLTPPHGYYNWADQNHNRRTWQDR